MSLERGVPAEAWCDSTIAAETVRTLAQQVRPLLTNELPVSRSGDLKKLTGPWDVIPFSFAGSDPHNDHPHISIVIRDQIARIQTTLPSKAKARYWDNLLRAGSTGVHDVLAACDLGIDGLRRNIDGALWEPTLALHAHQRHYRGPSDRRPIRDGYIEFDVEAILTSRRPADRKVKLVPAWLTGFLRIVSAARREANVELALAARFPNHDLSVSRTDQFPRTLAASAAAMRPFVELLRG